MTTNEQRLKSIEAIRAVAQFLEDHPELEGPRLVSVTSYVRDVETLERLAEQFGVRIYGPDSRPQFSVPIGHVAAQPLTQVLVAWDSQYARKFV
jgi:hypothetical protein